ncbi:hypothetical protein V5799_003218 [Amblyomma americanum]|uniref:Uncharacterized protein n=1 Tax=Amblyomma americanum TaxID=6943 RepID=A0AAQ4D9K8_AMBAM
MNADWCYCICVLFMLCAIVAGTVASVFVYFLVETSLSWPTEQWEYQNMAIVCDAKKCAEVAKRIFFNSATNTWLKLNEKLLQPQLADTLRKIAASKGADIFYTGDLAKAIAARFQTDGGIITPEDFSSYKAEWKPALAAEINGKKTVHTAPFPASGAIVGALLDNVTIGFGGKYFVSGIFMNNYMDAFGKAGGKSGRTESPVNLLRPRKRPLTFMVPAIVTNTSKKMNLHAVLGASGGLAAISALAQVRNQ